MTPGTTSSTLLLRLRTDDSEAWRRFDSFYLPLVRRWCHRLQPADREDIAQQTAERVRATIAQFDRRRSGSFRTWLRTIVNNLLKDFYRSSTNVVPTVVDDMIVGIAQPSEAELDEDRFELYQRAVQIIGRDFCEEWCRCFEGIVIHGLTARELADELGMNINAVRAAKFRVLKRLKEEFLDLIDDPDDAESF